MELTLPQKLTIAMGVVGAATTAFGALGPIMTSTETLIGTVCLGFVSACLAVVGTVVSSLGSQIKTVGSLPGVERIAVNANASATLAAAATDPNQPKVGAVSPEARAVLIDTVKSS